ncbi:unnamed protein product [Amoebophrya sp. A120]|nr:unnamed protein product [Amoebophrya sp. A120]|eukprot:GSA120T00014505001.1
MPAAVPKSGARQVIVQDAPESKAGAWWIQIVFCIGLLIMVCGIPEFIRTPLVKIGLLSPIHRATARHILVSEESKAQELKSEIDNRLERFEELARKHSISMMRVMQYEFFVVVFGRVVDKQQLVELIVLVLVNVMHLTALQKESSLVSVLSSRMLLICMLFSTKKNSKFFINHFIRFLPQRQAGRIAREFCLWPNGTRL